MLKKMTLLSAATVAAFAMHTGEININDKDLELNAKFDIGQFNDAVEPNTMFVGGRFLNADADHSDDEHADIDPFYEVNFLMMRPIGNHGMKVGLGAKLNHTKDFTSVPLGLEFSYRIPAADFVPMHLNGQLYYAPSVLAFSKADSFMEYRLSYDIELIKNGNLTVGYRKLDTDYEGRNGDFTYNSSWYIGFKIGF
ncbi:YfaZ family outer membrane protein [Sulfurimonas paralvinellae]|uniref:Outer membrane protein beta-barrel domain-containing protein n=1 Tax=Sulfurimonas paralvinellae TaxID=317658 RepID=A0A7M1B922_9BACT|nr:YfaZ family outer membrane protein [Sulfurimonas paralvinellae]QOP46131.1 hypothetical protein FM071_07440 [Sulfurimonas paralvinellae]